MGGGGCSKCDNHPIRDFFKNLFSKPRTNTSAYISEQEIHDADKATLQEVVRINEALTEFRLQSEVQSDSLENKIIKDAREGLDAFLDMLKKQNHQTFAGRKLNLNISAIERDNREMEDMIHGFIKKRVQKEVSTNNSKCREVLMMEKGDAKKQAMDNFLKEVTSTAITDLSEELRKVIRRQSENVEDRVQVRIDEIEVSLNDNMKKFEKIKSLKETDSAELEKEKLELISVSSICSMGMALLK